MVLRGKRWRTDDPTAPQDPPMVPFPPSEPVEPAESDLGASDDEPEDEVEPEPEVEYFPTPPVRFGTPISHITFTVTGRTPEQMEMTAYLVAQRFWGDDDFSLYAGTPEGYTDYSGARVPDGFKMDCHSNRVFEKDAKGNAILKPRVKPSYDEDY